MPRNNSWARARRPLCGKRSSSAWPWCCCGRGYHDNDDHGTLRGTGGNITKEGLAKSFSIAALKNTMLKQPIRTLTRELSKLVPGLGQVVEPSIAIVMIEAAGWVLGQRTQGEVHYFDLMTSQRRWPERSNREAIAVSAMQRTPNPRMNTDAQQRHYASLLSPGYAQRYADACNGSGDYVTSRRSETLHPSHPSFQAGD